MRIKCSRGRSRRRESVAVVALEVVVAAVVPAVAEATAGSSTRAINRGIEAEVYCVSPRALYFGSFPSTGP